ncbi:MAG: FliO/MopB family protein [Bacteriovoracaceae bacterium]|nr:FliO/MopB family protein [Bacteriovoracaceae bacterium]
MKAALKILAVTTMLLMAGMAYGAGKFKITDLALQEQNGAARVTIKYQGPLVYPELFVKDSSIIQLTFGDAIVWPKIEKKAPIANSPFDVVLMAYQYNPRDVRIRAVLPYSIKGDENKVRIETNEEQKLIEVFLPAAAKDNTLAAAISAATKNNANKYDENYLAMLLQDKSGSKDAKQDSGLSRNPEKRLANANARTAAATQDTDIDFSRKNKTSKLKQDQVSSVLAQARNNPSLNASLAAADECLAQEQQNYDAANSKHGTNLLTGKLGLGKERSFSLGTYVIKFVVFLAMVIALFYGAVALFKKGMAQNRKKIGLLKDLDSVVVLSTTYLGPKKSLVLVKAHQQVILLATSEQGVHFLAEIRDVPNLLKISEKEITGENFDTNLKKAETETPEPQPVAEAEKKNDEKSLTEFLASDAAKTKLAQDLQKKVRPLRPIQ